MERVEIDPKNPNCLPTRRTPLKKWKLDSIEKAFENGDQDKLPAVILFERESGIITADGNHRIFLAMKYGKPIAGIQLEGNEEFLLVGNPDLNYGKRQSHLYQNHGLYGNFVDYCRFIADMRGYKNFQDLYRKMTLQKV